MSFDGEGGHWYEAVSGKPCYSVIGRNGRERSVWVTDARRLGLVPSVTTVANVRAKPQLTKWLVKQGILAALTLPKVDGESDDAWIDRIMHDSKQQVVDAANEGTRIHDAIECHFAGKPYPDRYNPHVTATLAELARIFPGVNDWVSEKSFSHPLGYGGKVDLHSPSTGIVTDFKGRDGDFTETDAYGKPKKLAWDQHIQLAAYQVGLKITPFHVEKRSANHEVVVPDFSQCANIFVSRTHPGAVASHVWSADDIAAGWAQFECELALWKCINKFNGAY